MEGYMKRLLVISVLVVLFAPAPAQAGMDLWPIDGLLYCSQPQKIGCFRPDLKKEYKVKKAQQYYKSIDPRVYQQASSDYKKTAMRKPGRAVPDSRVK
jgi:hypothetical protein